MSQKEFGDGSTDGPRCVWVSCFSLAQHTYTRSRFNCTESKRRRRLIKRNYSKCMVLKKGKRKKSFLQVIAKDTQWNTQRRKEKKNLVGGEESKTFLIYYLYISCKILQVKIKLKVCASLCASGLRARGGIGTLNKCYRDNTHTERSLRRSVKQAKNKLLKVVWINQTKV